MPGIAVRRVAVVGERARPVPTRVVRHQGSGRWQGGVQPRADTNAALRQSSAALHTSG
jgi:hypothetical protein